MPQKHQVEFDVQYQYLLKFRYSRVKTSALVLWEMDSNFDSNLSSESESSKVMMLSGEIDDTRHPRHCSVINRCSALAILKEHKTFNASIKLGTQLEAGSKSVGRDTIQFRLDALQ